MGLAEEADLEELIRQKEALVAERDGQVQAIVALRGEVRWAAGGRGCWLDTHMTPATLPVGGDRAAARA